MRNTESVSHMIQLPRREFVAGVMFLLPFVDARSQGQCEASGMTLEETLAAWGNSNTKDEIDKSAFSIFVQRKEKGLFVAVRKGVGETEEIGVIGELSLNGKRIGTVVENDAMRITAGAYRGVLHYVSNEGKKIVQGPLGEMAVTGDFLIEVAGVQNRKALLFHQGTKPQHSEGCILAGAAAKKVVKFKDKDGKEKERDVITISDDSTLRNLRKAFYGVEQPVACPRKIVRIEIRDI